MERLALAKGAQTAAEQLDAWGLEKAGGHASDMVMKVMALVESEPVSKKRHWIVLADDEASAISIPADDEDTAAFDIVAIVDPLSREAQRLGPLLSVLQSVVNADLKLVLNPKPKLSEMPLKKSTTNSIPMPCDTFVPRCSFYRLVLEPELEFGADGSLKAGPVGRFGVLPVKTLLTLNLHAPGLPAPLSGSRWNGDGDLLETRGWWRRCPPSMTWTTSSWSRWRRTWWRSTSSPISFSKAGALLSLPSPALSEGERIEGHCFDEVTGQPPRGLQFVLGTGREPEMEDTIVMANLGYFQLKANPGSWLLNLRGGRNAELYTITTHSNTESEAHTVPVQVVLDSFTGKVIRIKVCSFPIRPFPLQVPALAPQVAKRPGKENEKLLGEASSGGDPETGGIWHSITEFVPPIK